MSQRLVLVCVSMVLSAPALAAQTADSLPPGVTADMVATGNRLFHGAGICFSCHGQDAKGTPGLGPDLGDAQWLHGDGSYEYIVRRIMAGVPADSSTSGVAMPPRGGSRLTDDQVREVAAYVWHLRVSR